MATIAQALARFGATLQLDDVPDAARRRLRELALDFLAVATAAAGTETAVTARRAAAALSGAGPATVVGGDCGLKPEYAALANAATAHAIEMDDVTEESSLHPGVVVFPTALAMAEACKAPPADMVVAAIIGYEVIGRLGDALNVRAHYARGFHPTATCGTFAAAAVAARLLGLDAGRTAHALGIAGSMAAGSMQYLEDGAAVKRAHPGLAAHAGIVAAHLAAEGLTGPAAIIEGERGFFHAYSEGATASRVLAGLGRDWQVLACAVKPHACCRYNHAAIDAALQIVAARRLSAGDVRGATVRVPTSSLAIVAEPRAVRAAPRNVVDAQFSLPYAVAVAVRHGRASLPEYTDAVIADPEVRRLAAVVECVGDEALEAAFPVHWGARVDLRLADGTHHEAHVPDAKGSPRNPLTWDELASKARTLTDGVLAADQQALLIDVAGRLESLPDLRPLLAPLARR